MSKSSRREAGAVLLARLYAVHPLMFAPAVVLLVLILTAVALAAVAILVAAVALAAGAGAVLCLHRLLVAVAAFEGRSNKKRPAVGGAE